MHATDVEKGSGIILQRETLIKNCGLVQVVTKEFSSMLYAAMSEDSVELLIDFLASKSCHVDMGLVNLFCESLQKGLATVKINTSLDKGPPTPVQKEQSLRIAPDTKSESTRDLHAVEEQDLQLDENFDKKQCFSRFWERLVCKDWMFKFRTKASTKEVLAETFLNAQTEKYGDLDEAAIRIVEKLQAVSEDIQWNLMSLMTNKKSVLWSLLSGFTFKVYCYCGTATARVTHTGYFVNGVGDFSLSECTICNNHLEQPIIQDSEIRSSNSHIWHLWKNKSRIREAASSLMKCLLLSFWFRTCESLLICWGFSGVTLHVKEASWINLEVKVFETGRI